MKVCLWSFKLWFIKILRSSVTNININEYLATHILISKYLGTNITSSKYLGTNIMISKYSGTISWTPNIWDKYHDLQIFWDKYHDIQIFQVRQGDQGLPHDSSVVKVLVAEVTFFMKRMKIWLFCWNTMGRFKLVLKTTICNMHQNPWETINCYAKTKTP